jgi:ribosomal protein L7/L12
MSDDDARIRRLDEQVALLHAIKRCRDLTGVALKEARDAVDELERRYRLG